MGLVVDYGYARSIFLVGGVLVAGKRYVEDPRRILEPRRALQPHDFRSRILDQGPDVAPACAAPATLELTTTDTRVDLQRDGRDGAHRFRGGDRRDDCAGGV